MAGSLGHPSKILVPRPGTTQQGRRFIVEITVTARHTSVSDRFRRHLEDKLSKIETLASRVDRIDVKVDHEANPRLAAQSERIELTVRESNLVIRAEAAAGDLYGALDIAQDKLVERLRRAHDRRKPHTNRRALQEAKAQRHAALPPQEQVEEPIEEEDYSPIAIRRKTHSAAPMSLDDALYEMELVGHDFFLFVDTETNRPTVVYRRRGWSYGVIDLVTKEESQIDDASEATNGKLAPTHSAAGKKRIPA